MAYDYKISEIQSFGNVAAEDDSVLEYFLSTNAVEKIEKNQSFLVLGRKGSGKTAIVRYLTEGNSDRRSKSLNLRGYPWNIHATRIDYGASDIEAYVSSWRYLIAVEFASLFLAHPNSSRTHKSEAIDKFMLDNYGGPHPSLSDIMRPKVLRFSKASIVPSVMGNQIGGVELERKSKDHDFGLQLNAVSNAIFSQVMEAAKSVGITTLSLHFDELDQGLSQLDDSRTKMLIGLIISAREIRRQFSSEEFSFSPVVYLRTDIWDELKFSDKNKISQNSTLSINWDSSQLFRLIDTRIKIRLGERASWENISEPDLIRGSQKKWDHIIARTFLRPRDVIQFLNELVTVSTRRDQETCAFNNKDIVASRIPYSNYLKSELDDEIGPHWSNWEDAIQAITAIGEQNFDRQNFQREYNARRSNKNELSAEDALSELFRFSVIGYRIRSGYGGSGWAFKYANQATGWDSASTNFKVHPGLKDYAKLKEARS